MKQLASDVRKEDSRSDTKDFITEMEKAHRRNISQVPAGNPSALIEAVQDGLLLFEEAKREIFTLLMNDAYQRFLNKPFVQMHIQEYKHVLMGHDTKRIKIRESKGDRKARRGEDYKRASKAEAHVTQKSSNSSQMRPEEKITRQLEGDQNDHTNQNQQCLRTMRVRPKQVEDDEANSLLTEERNMNREQLDVRKESNEEPSAGWGDSVSVGTEQLSRGRLTPISIAEPGDDRFSVAVGELGSSKKDPNFLKHHMTSPKLQGINEQKMPSPRPLRKARNKM